MTPPPGPAGRAGYVWLGVWVACVAFTAAYLDRGWVPHDEGLLGQEAERVLAGELPHQDFVEAYTGGLSFLHAGAFALWGVRLLSMRIALLLVTAAAIPALYYVASRFVGPWGAGLATVLAVAWSVPNYPAAVPSWYNLWLAVLGTGALMRFTETSRPRWLFAAGVAGGLSFLVKVAGLYFIAAGLLFLVFVEQEFTAGPAPRRSPYRLFVTVSLVLFGAALLGAVAWRPGLPTLVHFVFPGLTLATLLVWRERQAGGAAGQRFGALARLTAPFLAGAAIPVILFLFPYALRGALADFVHGVFVQPAARLTFAAMEPPPIWRSLFATAPLALFLAADTPAAPWRAWHKAVAVAGMLGVLDAASGDSPAYQIVWQSVRLLVPAAVLAGAVVLARGVSPERGAPLFLLIAMTAMVSLVQFPFTAPVYFLYVAPLAVVTLVALLRSAGAHSRFPSVSGAVFYLAFALLFVNGSSIYRMGQAFVRAGASVPLALPRAGILVPAADAATYGRLVELVDARAGKYIYATPDCPEVYFLTGRANPLPTLFEFLETDPPDEAQVLAALAARDVRVVVVNRKPQFSSPVDSAVQAALEARFPDSTLAGAFVVRWKS